MIYTNSQSKINTQGVNEYSKNLTFMDKTFAPHAFPLQATAKVAKKQSTASGLVWGILLFSRDDLAFINLRSLLSSLLKALHVCLFATLNNKRIVFVGDPQPLVQEHQQRLFSCFISNQVKSFTTKMTELLPPLLSEKGRSLAAVFTKPSSLAVEQRAKVAVKTAEEEPFVKSDVKSLRLRSRMPEKEKVISKKLSAAPLFSSLHVLLEKSNDKKQEKDALNLNTAALAPSTIALDSNKDKSKDFKVYETLNFQKEPLNHCPQRESEGTLPVLLPHMLFLEKEKLRKNLISSLKLRQGGRAYGKRHQAEFEEMFSLKKGLRKKLIMNQIDLEQKVGLSTLLLSSEATQLLPEAQLLPLLPAAQKRGEALFSFTTENLTWPVRLRQGKQGEAQKQGKVAVKAAAKVSKGAAASEAENKLKLDERYEKAQAYFFYTGMAKLASKAAIRSSQWTATLAQPTNLWVGGFFSNNLATYKQSLSSATLLNLKMDSESPFLAEAQGLASQELLLSENNQNLTEEVTVAPFAYSSKPYLAGKAAVRELREWKQTNSEHPDQLTAKKSYLPAGNRFFIERSLLSSFDNYKQILQSVDSPLSGLWNAIYTPVPRKNLGNNLEEKALNYFQRRRQLKGFRGKLSFFRSRLKAFRDATTFAFPPLQEKVVAKYSGAFPVGKVKKPFKTSPSRKGYGKKQAQNKLRAKTFGIRKLNKKFHEKALSHCLHSIETNYTTNAWLKEADLVFFANPEKTLSLLNQINRLKIPTLGIINTGSNLAFPFRSVKGSSLLVTKPTVNYPIIGNANSLNFLRLVLTKFACVLNLPRRQDDKKRLGNVEKLKSQKKQKNRSTLHEKAFSAKKTVNKALYKK